jgi:periplasmic divalent cation tolerance protein
MTPVIVLTSVAADFDARPLARALVEMRLAACVSIVPGVTSVYRWKERIEEDGEQLLVIKTADDNVETLRMELLARHPYEVPEFLVLPVAATSDAYGAWLMRQLTAAIDN